MTVTVLVLVAAAATVRAKTRPVAMKGISERAWRLFRMDMQGRGRDKCRGRRGRGDSARKMVAIGDIERAGKVTVDVEP